MCEKDLANVFRMFNVTSKIIATNISDGILVHCKKGHHRSSSIVTAYLIKDTDYTYEEAIIKINKLRPLAMRRYTCMSYQVYKFNNMLHNKKCKKDICKKSGSYYHCQCADK
jgi:protein-tyrosine phosphatase